MAGSRHSVEDRNIYSHGISSKTANNSSTSKCLISGEESRKCPIRGSIINALEAVEEKEITTNVRQWLRQ